MIKKNIFYVLVILMGFVSIKSMAADNCAAFAPFHTVGIFQQGRHFSCSCDSCHKSGVFKGTPSSCKACHIAGGRATTIAPPSHIPTSGAECSNCHTPSNWVPATMSHSTVAATSCETCHSGTYRAAGARAKHPEHIPTTLTCSTCHKSTNNWDAKFAHQGVVAGTCNTCHNGSGAKGKPPVHVPTAASCDACHLNYNSFVSALMNHVGITGSCETCHNGVLAGGKTATHPSTPASCVICHTIGNNWICKTGQLKLWIKQVLAQLAQVFA